MVLIEIGSKHIFVKFRMQNELRDCKKMMITKMILSQAIKLKTQL